MHLYRLHRSRYSASSGEGAAKQGGRWNPAGVPVIYTAESRALAALEVLVHFSVVPKDYVCTPIWAPEDVSIGEVPIEVLAPGWDGPLPIERTRNYGKEWAESGESAILKVPSTIVPAEFNFVINVRHPQFAKLRFEESVAFPFDTRLK